MSERNSNAAALRPHSHSRTTVTQRTNGSYTASVSSGASNKVVQVRSFNALRQAYSSSTSTTTSSSR